MGKMDSPPRRHLDRSLGLSEVIAISMGAMLGGGLFVLPGPASALSGTSLPLAYALSCLLVIPAALAKSELSTAIPTSGGSYLYIERSLGPWMGCVAGLGLWLSMLLKSSFALAGISVYLDLVIPGVSYRVTAIALLVVITILNSVGVKWVGRVQRSIILVTTTLLVILVVKGLLTPAEAAPPLLLGITPGGLLAATGLVFVSFAGVTKIAAVAEEVERPSVNLPRGIMLSLASAGLIYIFIAAVLVRNIEIGALSSDMVPIDTLSGLLLGPLGRILAVVAAVITLTAMANAGLLSASRFPLAMARDKALPAGLTSISASTGTPLHSILLSSMASAAAILFLDIVLIAKLASSFVITIFILELVTVIVFRETGAGWYRPAFRVPLYPWTLIIGICGMTVVLLSMGLKAVLSVGAIGLLGTLWYLAYARSNVSRRGLVRKAGSNGIPFAAPMPVERGLPRGDRSTIVALFGDEASPEQLLITAHSLARKGRVEVLYIEEHPELTEHGLDFEDTDKARALARRLDNTSNMMGVEHDFDVIITEDVRRTIHRYIRESHAEWLVMERRRAAGRIILGSPYRWFLRHLPVRLALYRGMGIRITKRIMVWPTPGPNDMLVVGTAISLAERLHSELTFVTRVDRRGGLRTRQAAADYLDQLLKAAEHPPAEALIIDGTEFDERIIHLTADHDLFVMGTDAEVRRFFSDGLLSRKEDRLIEASFCPALLLKTPVRMDIRFDSTSRIQATGLGEILESAVMGIGLETKKKQDLFRVLAGRFAEALSGLSEERILKAFNEREAMQNTSVGYGVAMPHATIEGLETTHLGIFTLKFPMDYRAEDEEPVSIIFATVGPPGRRETHLRLLALLARMGSDESMRKGMKTAANEDEVRRLITGFVVQM